MKQTKIAALRDSISQLESEKTNQIDEITESNNYLGKVIADPISAAKKNEETNRQMALAQKKAQEEAEFNKHVHETN